MTVRISLCLLLLTAATVRSQPLMTTAARPKPAPVHFVGLIGEYEQGRSVVYVFERNGELNASIGWFLDYALTQETPDVYRFPDNSLYHRDTVRFRRDARGKGIQVQVSNISFKRRKLDGEDGETFRIKPQWPIDELRKKALAAKPPLEKKEFRATELVELTALDTTLKTDLRYATDNNFLSTPLYPASAKAYMQKPAAEAVARASAKLKVHGFGLLIFDSYRPWYVTRIFYDATPEKLRSFVADPLLGSRHNRGCAVDLTLYDLRSGKPVDMVSGFDEFSDRAFPDYHGGTSLQRWHRKLLRTAMESEGFSVFPDEWWHYDYKDWRQYRIGNQTFEELEKKR